MRIAISPVPNLSREIEQDRRLVEAIAADLLRRCSACGRLDWSRARRLLSDLVMDVRAEAAAATCLRRRGEGVAPPAGHRAQAGAVRRLVALDGCGTSDAGSRHPPVWEKER
jgi:hypothetical protein